MTSWAEILKANKGLHARDSFSELWGLKLKAARAEFPDYTITGTPPLSFNSRVAGALKNYRIYGDSDGVGEETENIIVGYIDNASIQLAGGKIVFNPSYDLAIAPITQGVKYGVLLRRSWKNTVYGFFTNYPSNGSITYNASRSDADNMTSFVFEAPITGYVALWSAHNAYYHNDICVVQSDSAPASYIPPGYKIPISLESGVTENLVSDIINHANISSSGKIVSLPVTTPMRFDISIAEVELGKEYTFVTNDGEESVFAFYTNFPQVGETSYNNSRTIIRGLTQTFTSPIDGYICVRSYNGFDQVMITPGSTAPDHYIPHRYESNYDLMIGSTKLGAEEYVDYAEQKIYKMSGSTLVPTDPPAPLPAINTYKGENNLSVDTTVQPEKVAVEYEGWKGVGDVEKYQNGEWSDNNGT